MRLYEVKNKNKDREKYSYLPET